MTTAPPQATVRANKHDRLNGWKEIAAHFGKGVRTVQRWEAELGLPVHRLGRGTGEILYAFVPELDAWEASAAAVKPSRNPAKPAGSRADVVDAVAPTPDERPRPKWRPRMVRPVALLIVAGIVVAAVVLGSLFPIRLFKSLGQGQPASWRVASGVLTIVDADGRFLWEHRFEFPLTQGAYYQAYMRAEGRPPVLIHDVDGDGDAEVLFVAEPWQPKSYGLYCFSRDGSIRFHHAPRRVVGFGDKKYGPPWRGTDVYVTGLSGRPHEIWFVSTHLEEFPTVVERLDASGKPEGEYWSNGHVSNVVKSEAAGRELLFVGAISNEFRGGSVAILDARHPSGAAPASSRHYQCQECPPGTPLAFLVFPRLDMTAALGSYSRVTNVFRDNLGQILVDVNHDVGERVPEELRGLADSHYTLDSQFRVIGAELGRRVAPVHRVFEQKGLLDHPFIFERESRDLWPVLRWTGTAFIGVDGPEARR